jgi:hypothetical protein
MRTRRRDETFLEQPFTGDALPRALVRVADASRRGA